MRTSSFDMGKAFLSVSVILSITLLIQAIEVSGISSYDSSPSSSGFGGAFSSRSTPSGGYPRGKPSSSYGVPDFENSEPARYQFNYAVEAPGQYGGIRVSFGHQESRDGEVTQGSYYVLLPDGRVQNVIYTADRAGYHPRVTYRGGGGGGGKGGY